MFHGHILYKVTFLLLYYYFPLICILLLAAGGGSSGCGVQLGEASSSSSGNNYFSGANGANSGAVINNGNRNVNSNSNERGPHYATLAGSGDHRDGGPKADSSSINSEDSLRREFIKVQILQRLGLNEKPHVDMAHKISKDLVLETLRRTENLNSYHDSISSSSSSSSSSLSSLSSSSDTTSTPAATTYHNERHVPSSHGYANNSSIVVDEETGVANYAKTSEIISFPDKGPVLNGHNLLTFSYAGSQAFGVGVRVKRAHLWVKLDYRSSIGRHFGHLLAPKGITLYVFQVHGNFSTQNFQSPVHLNIQDVDLELVVKRTISLDALGWQKLDVTSVVQKWYGKSRHRIRHANSNRHHNHRDKLTLLVDCSGCGYCIQPIIFSRTESSAVISNNINNEGNEDIEPFNKNNNNGKAYHQNQNSYFDDNLNNRSGDVEGDDDYYNSSPHLETSRKVDNFTEMPFLVLETESAPNFKRSRRRALECSPRVKHCCKQRFYISFKDLDWDDWVIAPRGYYANYCRGSCGGPHRTPDTFLNYHTHVLEEYRRTPEGQVNLSGITPCCAPTKFAPMSLIYFGPDLNIIKRDLPKMIVEECGCP